MREGPEQYRCCSGGGCPLSVKRKSAAVVGLASVEVHEVVLSYFKEDGLVWVLGGDGLGQAKGAVGGESPVSKVEVERSPVAGLECVEGEGRPIVAMSWQSSANAMW